MTPLIFTWLTYFYVTEFKEKDSKLNGNSKGLSILIFNPAMSDKAYGRGRMLCSLLIDKPG
jgi:hypothetical protein